MRTADILPELDWRGLFADCTDRAALERRTAAGPLTLYCGFDPTADSLHVGNLVPLLALRRFQLAGHRPIALAGGATGMIGDPSGKADERSLLTPDQSRIISPASSPSSSDSSISRTPRIPRASSTTTTGRHTYPCSSSCATSASTSP